MLFLRTRADDQDLWPTDWPRWEMREVEHWLCEYDKWCRVMKDKKRMKRRYQR
jgi:hypothetical protein